MYEHKFYGERVRRFGEKITAVLYDAYRRMDSERARAQLASPLAEEVNILSWPADRGCEQTSLVLDETRAVAYVYHGRTFVRRIETPNDAFWAAVGCRQLPSNPADPAWATFGADRTLAHV